MEPSQPQPAKGTWRPAIDAVARAPEDAQADGADCGIIGRPVDQAVVVGVCQRLLLEVREHPDEDAAADEIAIGCDRQFGPQFSRAIPYG